MKKIHILESKLNEITSTNETYFCAGTDTPYYEDKDGDVYEANWQNNYGYPFGYWPIDDEGNMAFFIADPYETHCQACGKAAERYVNDLLMVSIADEAREIYDGLTTLEEDFEELGYTYNEENDNYVSKDGDEKDASMFAEDIYDEIYTNYIQCYDYIYSLVEDFLSDGVYPDRNKIEADLSDLMDDEYDYTTQKGINEALELVGSSFSSFFESGCYEGRIWPDEKMMGFYTSEQPSPIVLKKILRDLEDNNPHDYISVDEMLEYMMVFEDWYNDGKVTACTISDYIDGNYGPESEKESDEPRQYGNGQKTVFVPHLADQDQKREFFKDFRNTRDRAVYVPREKGGGTLAAYHAMRYPYGESKKMSGSMVSEENSAGTDNPYFYNGEFEIGADYMDNDAYPFGYFYNPLTDKLKFMLGDGNDTSVHNNLICEIIGGCVYSIIKNTFDNDEFNNEMESFFEDMKERGFKRMGYTSSLMNPNHEIIEFKDVLQNYFDKIGSTLKASEYMARLVFEVFENCDFEIPYRFSDEFYNVVWDYYDENDYEGLGYMFGIDYNEILNKSRLEGRIWIDTRLITFYPGQQPSREEMKMVIGDVADDLVMSESELYGYYTVFEIPSSFKYKGNGYHGNPDAEIQCCTVEEYINGDYNGFNRDEEIEMVKNRKGVENLNIHLADQERKKEFFKNFINTRDKAVYSPREKGAGTLAAYHAMRYPYGENKNKVGKIVTEKRRN